MAVTAVACTSLPTAQIDYGSGVEFVPNVVDAIDDVGLGASVAVDADGLPYVSYFGFPAPVAEGEAAPTRPIGLPFLPAVQLAHLTGDGYWNRGAAAESTDQPGGVTAPFGPETLADLADLTPQAANGTSVAVASDGTKHVAWTGSDGVWYASVSDSSSAERVFDYGSTISQAGPIGRASVAVDGDGNPWLSYAVNTAKGIEVKVATKDGDKWVTDTAATVERCNGCPQPGPAPIAVVGGSPTVAFTDAAAGTIGVWQLQGKDWASVDSLQADGASGLSMGGSEDAGYVAYYAGGKVYADTVDSDPVAVADADLGTTLGTGSMAPTTGVAVGGGKVYVAWQDAAGVHLASGDGSSFAQVETGTDTDGGALPALAVASDGSSAYLAWYDVETANLNVGVLGDASGLALAVPSPTLEVGALGACGGQGAKVSLNIVAKGIAFDTDCLVAEAGKTFTILFTNQDVGVQHNVHVFASLGGDSIAFNPLRAGVFEDEPLKVPALDEGDFYFQCDLHPAQMKGTLAVIKVK